MVIEVTFDVTDVYISTTVSPVYVNVSFEAPSDGGGTEWGDITGTLSDQTDLQTALDGKFDDPTGTSSQYIDGTGALQTFPLTLPVLQEVRNQTGATLDAGTVVYINGATGNKPTVTKAIATGDATSAQTLGMVSASIANNGVGYVVVIGICSGLDTSAYTEGQQLYLSYTTAGAVTTTKPYAPYHLVYIGIVTRAHPTLGTVEVRVQNGYELDEIHDVDALNPNNNDGIFYNSTTSLWEHKQISTALGYTPANSATTLTINGVTYDLSANRTWTISTGISGSGASGQVAYWDGTTSQTGSADLTWNGTNVILGNDKGLVLQTAGTNRNILIKAAVVLDNFSGVNLYPQGGTNVGTALVISPKGTGFSAQLKSQVSLFNTDFFADSVNYEFAVLRAAGDRFSFSTGKQGTGTNRPFLLSSGYADGVTNANHLWLYTNGNVGINTSSDSGQRLQVQGTTLLNGNVTFSSATGMFWDATNSRLGVGTNVPSAKLEIVSSSGTSSAGVSVRNNGTASNDYASYNLFNSNTLLQGQLFFTSASYTSLPLIGSNGLGFYSNGGNGITIWADTASIKFQTGTGGSAAGSQKMTIFSTGNVGIGTGNTDSGERLQVTGNAKVTGTTSDASANALRVLNSSSTVLINASNNGDVGIGTNAWLVAGGGQRYLYRFTNLTGIFTIGNDSDITSVIDFYGSNHATKPRTISLVSSFSPTSGSINFAGFEIINTINQTGSANGITRGLYVNATLTNAANFRAIETERGNVVFKNLPTSSAGLPTGAIWNDAGTIKIV